MPVSVMPTVDSSRYQCYAFCFINYVKLARTMNLLFLLKQGVQFCF